MNKIKLHVEEGRAYVAFLEYPEERQLKDFYKIYKKATGHLVLEYAAEGEAIVAKIDHPSSVRIAYDPARGCHLRADKADAAELAETLFGMLCYRYAEFKAFETLFEEAAAAGGKAPGAGLAALVADEGLDEGYAADLEAVLSLLRGVSV